MAKKLIEKNVKVEVVLGANSDQDLFYIDEFKAVGASVVVATITGSVGTKGFVTDAIIENEIKFDYYYACGPTAMLKSLHKMFPASGQLSFEERMACGFGACMGCVCKNKHYPYKRVCIDGPVFDVEEVLFDE